MYAFIFKTNIYIYAIHDVTVFNAFISDDIANI